MRERDKSMNLEIIILAAGQGKRMYSDTLKVLHPLAGKPLLSWVVDAAASLNPKAIHLIYGHEGEALQRALPDLSVHWVYQMQQLGTGHAVMQALPSIHPQSQVLILSADVPLITTSTLNRLMALQDANVGSLKLLLAQPKDSSGLGRIVRSSNGDILAVVEERDATVTEKAITEIYSGICAVSASDLHRWLPKLSNKNAQKEYYLTEIIQMAVQDNRLIQSITIEDELEVQGVNNRLQLQQLERAWQLRQASALLERGVGIADASRFDVRGDLICGKDVFIDVNCIFKGRVVLGDRCRIGPNCMLSDVTLEEDTLVLANSILEGSVLGKSCQIGPFARLRAGTELAENCRIGNFVETKATRFDVGSKAGHLSYLGDAVIGKKVNIGAGTITCNYDGVNKHQTVIEDGAFIGSGTELVAPISIGAHATIGAGSTIRSQVPADELTLMDSRQRTVYGWKRPVKKDASE